MPADTLNIQNADSLAWPALDTAAIADWAAADAAARAQARADSLASIPPAPPAWQSGIPPREMPAGAISDPAMPALIVVMLLVLVLSLHHCRHLLGSLVKDIWTVRNRSNNFDEHTGNETRLMVLFGAQLTVYLGLMLQVASAKHAGTMPFASSFVTTLCYIGVAAVLYIFQLVAYSAVGYAFTTPDNAQQWLRGFNAGQALLGFALAVPAVVAVFYPEAATAILITAASLYILARLVFICKGFRIFYINFGSILYFILYLCALEIIPPLLILAAACAIR